MASRTTFWAVDLNRLGELLGSKDAEAAEKLCHALQPELAELDEQLDDIKEEGAPTTADAIRQLVMGAELADSCVYGYVLELLVSEFGRQITVYSDGSVILGEGQLPPGRRFDIEIGWLFEVGVDCLLCSERGPWLSLPEVEMPVIEYLTRSEIQAEVVKVKEAIDDDDDYQLVGFLRYLETAREAQVDLVTFTH